MTIEGREALLFCGARDMFQQPASPVNSRRRREPSGATPKNFVALCNRPRFRAYRVYGPGSNCRSAVPGRSRMLTRRTALSGLAAIASASLLQATAARAGGDDHVAYSDAEWRARLTPEQYEILRKEGTERPFTSPLLHEERKGVSPAPAAAWTCSPPRPSSTAARAGRASGPRSTTPSRPTWTSPLA